MHTEVSSAATVTAIVTDTAPAVSRQESYLFDQKWENKVAADQEPTLTELNIEGRKTFSDVIDALCAADWKEYVPGSDHRNFYKSGWNCIVAGPGAFAQFYPPVIFP